MSDELDMRSAWEDDDDRLEQEPPLWFVVGILAAGALVCFGIVVALTYLTPA